MALEPVQDGGVPGLWREPEWKPGTPGLYALIVGASNYPHLAGGGGAPAEEAFGLGQLKVSASTALAVFKWLRSDFQKRDMPVVWCQLLLSPTPQEAARFAGEGFEHFGIPTYADLRQALQRWSGILPKNALPAASSRTFFFFSGHGLQANWRPLLLPSDYLDPSMGEPMLQNCISTREIREWMETHRVGEHLAVFDACRNEFSPLASKGATAHSILETNAATGRLPVAVATFSSTAPKATAYQSDTEGEKLSFFGKALLEGLAGEAGAPLHGNPGEMYVEFNKLVRYVKPRVNTLLKKHNEQLEQTGHATLEPSDAEVILTQHEASSPTLESFHESYAGPSNFPTPAVAQRVVDARFLGADPSIVPLDALRHFATAHHRFGHEFMSEIWSDSVFRIHSLARGVSLQEDQALVVQTEQQVLDNGLGAILRIDLQLPFHSGGVLAVFQHPYYVARGLLALPLPCDTGARTPIRLTLTFQSDSTRNGGPLLQRVEARLGPITSNPHYQYLWEISQRANFGSFADAAAIADPDTLRYGVRSKEANTTAAIAGAIILARGGKILTIGDWTRNLMHWFPNVTDGAVLWAETLRAALAKGDKMPFGCRKPLNEMADALSNIASRGVPFFTEAIDMADGLLRYLARRKDQLSPARRGSLNRVRSRIERTLQNAVSNGQFLTFVGQPLLEGSRAGTGVISAEEIISLMRPTSS